MLANGFMSARHAVHYLNLLLEIAVYFALLALSLAHPFNRVLAAQKIRLLR